MNKQLSTHTHSYDGDDDAVVREKFYRLSLPRIIINT